MEPSSPATSPEPKSMNTAMPLAVEERTTDPSSESAITTSTAPASSTPGQRMRSGHQWPVSPVIDSATKYTASTYATQTSAAPRKRESRSVARPTGRTTSGCRSPRSASPETTPRVRNTARTTPRKSVANIANPTRHAAANVRQSPGTSGGGEIVAPPRKTKWFASQKRKRNTAVSTRTTANTFRRTASRNPYSAMTNTVLSPS